LEDPVTRNMTVSAALRSGRVMVKRRGIPMDEVVATTKRVCSWSAGLAGNREAV
jgi:hypothetical protein